MSEVRRIIIEEVIPSRLEVPGQKQSEGGWRISPETAAAIPEAEFSAVILTIAGVVQQKLLRENAGLRQENAVLRDPMHNQNFLGALSIDEVGLKLPLPKHPA